MKQISGGRWGGVGDLHCQTLYKKKPVTSGLSSELQLCTRTVYLYVFMYLVVDHEP